jgi:4-diphosphocytidyl-2-C-methyl-D-erythritol kinase
MEEIAYAKVNLALHVRSREPDGYHRIETIFAFCEDGDRLSVRPGEGLSLQCIGPFGTRLGAPEDNLVFRAARALRRRAGVSGGAALLLDKRLPVASGIGGGSADAAAALRLLVRWWDLAPDAADLQVLARELGADVPACLESRLARGEGRGDVLTAMMGDVAGTPLLLVNPSVPLSTASVFKTWDGVDRGPLGELPGRNDLEAPALALAPVVGEVLEALTAAPGATFVRMSGSGATCFALFGSEAERDSAHAAIAAAQPNWWTLATRLR